MKKVLVVDDDPELLQYITNTLTRGGVPAVGANSGVEALTIFQQRKRDIRLLLTDIVMPQTTGMELARAIEKLDAKLPVVFMTGYKTDHLEQFGHALEGHAVLGKPFTPAELLAIVKDALAKIEKAKHAPG